MNEEGQSSEESFSDSLPADGDARGGGDDLLRQLQAELDEAVEARKRALADFKNYQRRASDNEHRASQMATARFVRAIMPVLDHFDLALNQKPEQMTLENLLQAVRIVRDEFTRALASQNVERIEPRPGDSFDPHRHQAVKYEQVEGSQPNSVVLVFQPGYALSDMILRPATVVVAAGSDAPEGS